MVDIGSETVIENGDLEHNRWIDAEIHFYELFSGVGRSTDFKSLL